jgi:hypothetical protein
MRSTGRAILGVLLAATTVLLLSCVTTREKTESYLFTEPGALSPRVAAWLRTVEVVSNSLPLTEDYALISDSLIAIASRYGFQLSTTRGDQPYVIDLVMHERTSVVDLATRSSIMAVLNVSTTTESPLGVARVVHSSVTTDSIVSLYQVTEIGEKVFASLRAAVEEKLQKSQDAARAAPAVAATQ